MAKLSDILGPVADILDVPRGSVNVWAMILRKHGLITTGGRGRGGAEMRPSDIANLLLAAMTGGGAKSINDDVSYIRSMRLVAVKERTDKTEGPYVPVDFFDKSLNFGEMIDLIISKLPKGDPIIIDTGSVVEDLSISVERPTSFGSRAIIQVCDRNRIWRIFFVRTFADKQDLSVDELLAKTREMKKPSIMYSAKVGIRTVRILSKLIGNNTKIYDDEISQREVPQRLSGDE
jgi:hypothetical protein